jgi:hypothetical protein
VLGFFSLGESLGPSFAIFVFDFIFAFSDLKSMEEMQNSCMDSGPWGWGDDCAQVVVEGEILAGMDDGDWKGE